MLLQQWHPGDTVLLYPPSDQVIYQFYLGKIYNRPAVLASLEPGDLNSLKPSASINQNQFLIAAFTRQQSMPQEIARDGFKQIAMFDIVNWGKQFLYDRASP